jgi:ubiquinol-cytochrome c reductase iron-sulfur subunit
MARSAHLDRQALQGRARGAADAGHQAARSQVGQRRSAAGLHQEGQSCSPEIKAEIRPEPFDPEWKGGYFCPCHKSRFDMAGRVFQGVPAPTNLVVPPHYYENDTTIIIGVDPKGAA